MAGWQNGTYSGPVAYSVGNNPSFIVTKDVNGDGRLDLIVTNYSDNTVSILLGAGNGSFAAAKNYPAGREPVLVGHRRL